MGRPLRVRRTGGTWWPLLAVVLVALLLPAPVLAHGGHELTAERLWWSWNVTPEISGPLLLAAVIYAAGMRRRAGAGVPVAPWRHSAFFAGIGLVFVSLQSPIDPIAERLFSVHQVQHFLLRMAGPMLLALAAPQGMLIAGLPVAARRSVVAPVVSNGMLGRIFSVLTRPAAALALFIAALYVWEAPTLHDAAVLNDGIHWIMHITMLAAGLLFFWLIFDRRAPPQGWRFGVRVIALLLTTLSNILLGGYTMLKHEVLYHAYDIDGRLFGTNPLTDELIGGYVIWVPSSMMCVIAILIVVYGMNRHEERQSARREVWTGSNAAALLYPVTAEDLVAQVRSRNRAIAFGFAALMAVIFVAVICIGLASKLIG